MPVAACQPLLPSALRPNSNTSGIADGSIIAAIITTQLAVNDSKEPRSHPHVSAGPRLPNDKRPRDRCHDKKGQRCESGRRELDFAATLLTRPGKQEPAGRAESASPGWSNQPGGRQRSAK